MVDDGAGDCADDDGEEENGGEGDDDDSPASFPAEGLLLDWVYFAVAFEGV